MIKINTRDLLPEMRPDEKLILRGAGALSDAELLSVIIRTGSRSYNSVDLARKILSSGLNEDDDISILNIFNYELSELMRFNGIGRVKAVQIKALAELSLRIAKGHARPRLVFNDPKTVSDYYMEQFRHEKQESVYLVMLDTALRLLNEKCIFKGTVNASLVSARDIFINALKSEAVWIIIIHNHPSGDPKPSLQDTELTEELSNLGSLIGIKLLDHIIIGDRRYFSFKESGKINE